MSRLRTSSARVAIVSAFGSDVSTGSAATALHGAPGSAAGAAVGAFTPGSAIANGAVHAEGWYASIIRVRSSVSSVQIPFGGAAGCEAGASSRGAGVNGNALTNGEVTCVSVLPNALFGGSGGDGGSAVGGPFLKGSASASPLGATTSRVVSSSPGGGGARFFASTMRAVGA
ncbi:MAG: hypothetical protein QM820_03900 [Minicystis sp.]